MNQFRIKNFAIVAVLLFSLKVLAAPVEIQINRVSGNVSPLHISLFANPQSWDKETPTSLATIDPATTGTSKTTLDLAPGDYAFFLFHDLDGNGVLKTKFGGLPAEPYAFSNDVVLGFSKPSWNAIKFTVTETGATQIVNLH